MSETTPPKALNVTDFGADPTGERDSTSAFQTALNLSAWLAKQDGDEEGALWVLVWSEQ